MKFNFSLDTAIIISLIAIFLFVSGQAYLGGFLRPFYVDPIVLNFSVQDKIYWGFLKALNPLITIFLIGITLYVLKYIYVSLELDQKIVDFLRRKIKFRLKHQVKPHNSSLTDELEKNYTTFTIYVSLIIGCSFMLFTSILETQEKGKKNGSEVLSNIKELPLIKITGNENNLKQYRILCGSALCAVIDEKKNVSLVEPKNILYLSSNFDVKTEK
ncbi:MULTISPECIES: hypothetical protein [Acinetobacter]|uniref:hypothetical protein n=1 Tax=Acinetobacter TaxID=469 RepID=UPI0004D5BA20|nr:MULTISPECIES: hypothetical protein [unclassified Acinetobacter]KEC86248.1 hypothetical protein DT74_07435 [Acinetobacter sp. ETR1]WEE37550.1 hypothetical protein PYV58_11365 [Acinetobacter sp. TAC-1]